MRTLPEAIAALEQSPDYNRLMLFSFFLSAVKFCTIVFALIKFSDIWAIWAIGIPFLILDSLIMIYTYRGYNAKE